MKKKPRKQRQTVPQTPAARTPEPTPPASSDMRIESRESSERGAIALFIVTLLIASALPYLAAWRATPEGRQFAGTTEASSDDYPTYLAKMRSGARWK